MSHEKHRTQVRVRYAETDQMGVVHHANYLVWMEIGRVEFVRSRGLSYRELEEDEGMLLSVIGVNCRYIYPARFDQEIVIETCVQKATSRLMEFSYEIRSLEPDRLLAEGTTRHLWLNKHMRPSRLPKHYEEAVLASVGVAV